MLFFYHTILYISPPFWKISPLFSFDIIFFDKIWHAMNPHYILSFCCEYDLHPECILCLSIFYQCGLLPPLSLNDHVWSEPSVVFCVIFVASGIWILLNITHENIYYYQYLPWHCIPLFSSLDVCVKITRGGD